MNVPLIIGHVSATDTTGTTGTASAPGSGTLGDRREGQADTPVRLKSWASIQSDLTVEPLAVGSRDPQRTPGDLVVHLYVKNVLGSFLTPE